MNNSIINTAKSVADVTGLINEGVKYLLTIFDPQSVNAFDIIFTSQYPLASMSSFESISLDVLSNVITKLYIQTIDFTVNGFSYERANSLRYVSDIVYPDEVTITFLEDDMGTVRTFLNKWSNMVAYTTDSLSLIEVVEEGEGLIFADNQSAAKKKAIIVPSQKSGIPSLVWFELKGLKFSSISNITFDQSDANPMRISATFSVDSIRFKTLL